MRYFLDTEFLEGIQSTSNSKSPTIDLISIGIKSESGATYYAISNEFNLNEVWNSIDPWVKNNVIKLIFEELKDSDEDQFNYVTVKNLIDKKGKSRSEIKSEVLNFIQDSNPKGEEIKFYGYYADYDWVVFCWLFGKMMDLPKGFPMYCRDLKQLLDNINSMRFIHGLPDVKNLELYPKNSNEHNALKDAEWNFELYKFLKSLVPTNIETYGI